MNVEFEISEEEQLKNLNITWKNPPKLKDLKKDLLEASNSYNKQKTKIEEWLKLLEPEVSNFATPTRSKVNPRIIRKFNEWRYPTLEEPFMTTNDMFTVNPVTHLDTDSAKQHEKIINKQFRYDINKTKFINKYIKTAVDTGTVIVKLNWITEEAVVRQQVSKEVLLTDPNDIQAVLAEKLANGEIDEETVQAILQSGEPVPHVIEVIENKKTIIKDCPTLEVKDARNCYIDPACDGDIENVKYIIDKFHTNISELKKDGRYANLDYINLDSDAVTDYQDIIENKDDEYAKYSDKARKKLNVYEYWGYWDIEGNDTLELIRVFWVGNVIIRMERNPYPDKKMPYVIVQYMPILNSIYGEPDAVLLKDSQDIIGKLTRGMLDLMAKSANSQRAFRKDALDPINEKRMKEGGDFAFNAHINSPNDIFYINKYPEVPKSAFDLIMYYSNEAESLTGVKPFSSGIKASEIGDSVGGIKSVMDATAKREANILRRLTNGIIEIAKKIISMNTAFLSDEMILRITDDDKIYIKRDDLSHTYDLSLDISTAESNSDKINKLSFLLQTTGNTMDFNFTKLVLAEITHLMKMPEFSQRILDFEPQPDPLAQEKAMLEIELLKAQIANEQAKANENAVDVELKQAKTQTELAKAGKLGSERDKIDISTLNDFTGLTHDRELEKEALKQKEKNNLDNSKNIDNTNNK